MLKAYQRFSWLFVCYKHPLLCWCTAWELVLLEDTPAMLPSITSCSRSAPSISISKCSQVHQSIPKYYKVHQSILVKYSKVLWSIPKCCEVFQSIATGWYGWYGPSISRAPKYNASWCQLCQLCQLCCISILAKQNWEGSTWIWKWIGSP